MPLGIALGRWLWTLFARQIYAVPQPTVPAEAVILVTVGTLALANLVAAPHCAPNEPNGSPLREDQ